MGWFLYGSGVFYDQREGINVTLIYYSPLRAARKIIH